MRFRAKRHSSLYLSAYDVLVDGEVIGCVWSRRGFSYRGMQGWNRGVRIRDFHPLEWGCGQTLGDNRRRYRSRRDAADVLLLECKRPDPTGANHG